jgi:phosphate uptake regulator
MKRKVNRVGQNTLTVSLPSKWAKEHDVKAGEELEIQETGPNLLILKGEFTIEKKNVRLNIDNLDKTLINRYVHEFYRRGTDKIILEFSKDKITDSKNRIEIDVDKHIKKLSERFIGLEITSQTKNRIILQNLIIEEESNKLEIVQKRIYFLIKEFLDEFLKAMEGDFAKFNTRAYDYHDNIAKFTYYYFRLLRSSDLPQENKTRLFSLFMSIDKMMDKVRHTGERICEMKSITKNIKATLKEIFSMFLEHFDMISDRSYHVEELEDLIKRRYALVRKVNSGKFNEEESKVVMECKILLDNIVDFSETYIALNFEKHVIM